MKETDRAKEYLCQIPKVNKLIQRLCNTIATLRSNLTSVNCKLNPDKVQTSGPKDQMAITFARIDNLERKINTRIDELTKLTEDALKVIYQIPDKDQQNILIARYVQGIKWEKIAADLNFSISQVYRLHGKALVNFGKMIVNDS